MDTHTHTCTHTQHTYLHIHTYTLTWLESSCKYFLFIELILQHLVASRIFESFDRQFKFSTSQAASDSVLAQWVPCVRPSWALCYCNCSRVCLFPQMNLQASWNLRLAPTSLCSWGSQPSGLIRICHYVSIERKNLSLTDTRRNLKGDILKRRISVTKENQRGWRAHRHHLLDHSLILDGRCEM